jgi:hypothetical protein
MTEFWTHETVSHNFSTTSVSLSNWAKAAGDSESAKEKRHIFLTLLLCTWFQKRQKTSHNKKCQ